LRTGLSAVAPSALILAFSWIALAGHAHAQTDRIALETALADAYDATDPVVLAEAERVLAAEVARTPERLELHQALGLLYLEKKKDAARALPHLQKVSVLVPDDPAWLQSLARAHRQLGQLQRAAELYGRCADLSPGTAWMRYEQGKALGELGRFTEAEAAHRAAIAIDPRTPYLRVGLAELLARLGRKAEARTLVEAVLAQAPGDAWAKIVLAGLEPPPPVAAGPKPAHEQAVIDAYALPSRDRFRRAAEALEERLTNRPRDLRSRQTLAFLYLDKLEDPARAIPHLERVVAARPRDRGWLSLLARACSEANDHGGAARAHARVAALAPRDVWSRYHLAQALKKLGRTAEAEAALRDALSVDPQNAWVRIELARFATADGRHAEAWEIARGVVADHPDNAEAHTLLGDLYRAEYNSLGARNAYAAALNASPAYASAQYGLVQLARQDRRQAVLAYYDFDDTDGLHQGGVFGSANVLVRGPLRVSLIANERWFEQPPGGIVERFESGLSADYRLRRWIAVNASVNQFSTQGHKTEWGASAAVYVTPARQWDFWASYRWNDPVNDGYVTARDAFTQDILAGGVNVRFTRDVSASVTASTAEYSDDNTRRNVVASLAWQVSQRAAATLKLEWEWLDYERNAPSYPSPEDYSLIRPVLELNPQLTDWLRLQVRAELPYIADEESWGHGLTAGLRFMRGDSFELGVAYLDFDITGGQTIWSGSGWKLDVMARW
jgi:predicted Zn-dependent protease